MMFGEFLKEKRLEKEINLRKLAGMIEIAPAYLSDIEKGKRNSPNAEIMERLVTVLELTEDEKNTMFDLAAQERENTVAPDISEYVKANKMVRVALRKAQNMELSDLDWVKLIEQMEESEK